MLSLVTNALGFASGPYYGGKDDGMMMCPTEMPPPKYTGPIDYSICLLYTSPSPRDRG